ncbi:1352_t:CDS:2 [Dentiscutata erythropus]|uniref:Ribonuclease n=1 Tax=Dentiscutata erythropus TaxID=1348616 RepID=A0A9N9DK78_9GLOM|nr:1352_t:CDS:2 [Dentiscutata erythropus]
MSTRKNRQSETIKNNTKKKHVKKSVTKVSSVSSHQSISQRLATLGSPLSRYYIVYLPEKSHHNPVKKALLDQWASLEQACGEVDNEIRKEQKKNSSEIEGKLNSVGDAFVKDDKKRKLDQSKIFKVEKTPSSNFPANEKALEVEITTNFHISSLGVNPSELIGSLPDNPLDKLIFCFEDNAESTIYNDLLDSNKNNLELSFNKKTVNFWLVGMDNVDNTKPTVELYATRQKPHLRIFFKPQKPQFNNLIKLTATSQNPPGNNEPTAPSTKFSGVDEAGRGALAGPIIVAAVVLPAEALEYNVIAKSAREVETKNPLAATKEAMAEALVNLKVKPDLCLVDGKERVVVEGFKTVSVVGGDRRSINIAAASIISKVTRDTIMQKLHKKYPRYD